jgi:low affinity Fe/Cu permease
MNEFFHKLAHKSAEIMGSAASFMLALTLIIIWAVTGPFFHYSDTWQLIINTATTVLTFLIVFLIQNTQNRDAKAIHLKLDELIRSARSARNKMVDLEDMSESELDALQAEFETLRRRADEVRRRRI